MGYNRFLEMYRILNQWMWLRDNNYRVDEILLRKNYLRIAIYGMGDMAIHLINELRESHVDVKYIIDNEDNKYDIPVEVINKRSLAGEADAVICTRPDADHEYCSDLEKVFNCPVITITDLLFELI